MTVLGPYFFLPFLPFFFLSFFLDFFFAMGSLPGNGRLRKTRLYQADPVTPLQHERRNP